jgi:hypothetical protein
VGWKTFSGESRLKGLGGAHVRSGVGIIDRIDFSSGQSTNPGSDRLLCIKKGVQKLAEQVFEHLFY